jgi:hypothetical protein
VGEKPPPNETVLQECGAKGRERLWKRRKTKNVSRFSTASTATGYGWQYAHFLTSIPDSATKIPEAPILLEL